MQTIIDSFDILTELFFEKINDKNLFPLYSVKEHYSSEPGQPVQFEFTLYPQRLFRVGEIALYPERDIFAEEKANTRKYVALKKKVDQFKSLLSHLGIHVRYVDTKNLNFCKALKSFPSGEGTPAWALNGQVSDAVMEAMNEKIAEMKMQPDGKGARDRLSQRVGEKPAEKAIPL
jgi:hypothetical protein